MKPYLYRSIGLHIVVFLLFVLDLPFMHARMTIGQAPIIVDLKDVKLAEMTNLPPKAVIGDENKKATAPKEKKPEFTHEETKKPDTPPPAPEMKKEDKADYVKEVKPEPAPTPQPKPKPKPEPKPKPKPQEKPKPQAPTKPKEQPKPKAKAQPKQASNNTVANPLKSLMDSVSAMEKEIGEEAPAVIKEGTPVANMGIEGGREGSYFSELTISETDAIAGRLRECWNLDPGARGIENMVVEIRATLNRDGSLKDVKILDTARYNADPHFRAIAESARRAVWSCANKDNVNIYKLFPEKYADKYSLWQTLLLRFNPMDASIQ